MPDKRYTTLPAETLDGARAMLASGMRERDVAKHFGCSRDTLRKHGVAPVPRRVVSADEKARILAMRADRMAIKAICAATKWNVDAINRVLRDAGAVKASPRRGNVRKPAIDPALLALPGKMTVQLSEHAQRTRQSLRMRGMPDALALSEAMRLSAGRGT